MYNEIITRNSHNFRLIYIKERVNMKGEFTRVIEKRGKWYVGYIEEISGVNTQGRTVEEVRENLKEALVLIIEANRELARKSIQNPDVIRDTISVEM